MEKQYITNRDTIMHLCRYATDSLSLPDSTALVITQNNILQTRKVVGRNRVISYPIGIFTEDTVFDIDASQAQRIIQLHKAANIGEFTVYMPDSFSLRFYVKSNEKLSLAYFNWIISKSFIQL